MHAELLEIHVLEDKFKVTWCHAIDAEHVKLIHLQIQQELNVFPIHFQLVDALPEEMDTIAFNVDQLKSEMLTSRIDAWPSLNAQQDTLEDQEIQIAVPNANNAQLVKLPMQVELLVLLHKDAHVINTEHQMDTHAQIAHQDSLLMSSTNVLDHLAQDFTPSPDQLVQTNANHAKIAHNHKPCQMKPETNAFQDQSHHAPASKADLKMVILALIAHMVKSEIQETKLNVWLQCALVECNTPQWSLNKTVEDVLLANGQDKRSMHQRLVALIESHKYAHAERRELLMDMVAKPAQPDTSEVRVTKRYALDQLAQVNMPSNLLLMISAAEDAISATSHTSNQTHKEMHVFQDQRSNAHAWAEDHSKDTLVKHAQLDRFKLKTFQSNATNHNAMDQTRFYQELMLTLVEHVLSANGQDTFLMIPEINAFQDQFLGATASRNIH